MNCKNIPLLIAALSATLSAANLYTAPNGRSTNNGSISSPWDLQTAFSKASPGDTVWLRGGTYSGRYNCYASGTPTAPIIFRQYPGEHAVIATGPTQMGAITMQCHDVWLWGFEIYFTDPNRVSSQTGSFPTDINRGPGIEGAPDGSRCKLINMVIHDDFNTFIGNQAAQFEIYGSLFYFDGWDASDRGHGHAIYSQNNPSLGTKTILDNILFDSFAEGLHIYSSNAYMSNYDIEGNVVFNAGEPSATTGYTTNIIVGGSSVQPSNVTLIDNYTYDSPTSSQPKQNDGRGAWLGSTDGCSNFVVKGNFFVDQTGNALRLEPGCNPAMTGNTIFGSLSGFTSAQYPNNSYFTSKPTGENIFVRPNQFESGRANIIVYNWDQKPSVSVDVSSVLKPGDNYEVRDAQNFYGPPVAQGTYAGGSINIPMTSTAIARIVGNAPVVPVHTSPEFGVFVLVDATSSGSTGGTAGGTSGGSTGGTSGGTSGGSTGGGSTGGSSGGGSTGSGGTVAAPIASGVYSLKNVIDHLAVDDPGFSSASGQQIIQYGYNGGSNQKWLFSPEANGYYTIQNSSSGLYLTDPNNASPGAPLEQELPLGDDWQLWSVVPASSGAYFVKNKASGLFIDPGSSSTQGTGLILASQTGSARQSWSIF